VFDVNLEYDGVQICSIEVKDISIIQQWLLSEVTSEDIAEAPSYEELKERFLEYYLSENEFFIKLLKENELLGILKGRVEFKNPNEVWINSIVLNKKYRGMGIGSTILEALLNYFHSSFGIKNFFSSICAHNEAGMKFLLKNKFKLLRIAKNCSVTDSGYEDIIIFNREK